MEENFKELEISVLRKRCNVQKKTIEWYKGEMDSMRASVIKLTTLCSDKNKELSTLQDNCIRKDMEYWRNINHLQQELAKFRANSEMSNSVPNSEAVVKTFTKPSSILMQHYERLTSVEPMEHPLVTRLKKVRRSQSFDPLPSSPLSEGVKSKGNLMTAAQSISSLNSPSRSSNSNIENTPPRRNGVPLKIARKPTTLNKVLEKQTSCSVLKITEITKSSQKTKVTTTQPKPTHCGPDSNRSKVAVKPASGQPIRTACKPLTVPSKNINRTITASNNPQKSTIKPPSRINKTACV